MLGNWGEEPITKCLGMRLLCTNPVRIQCCLGAIHVSYDGLSNIHWVIIINCIVVHCVGAKSIHTSVKKGGRISENTWVA